MRRNDSVRITIALGLLTTLLLGSSCATFRGMAARSEHMKTATERYVYAKPIKKVWPHVRSNVFTLGLSVKNTGEAAGYIIETEPLYTENSGTGELISKSYLIQGIEEGPDQCRVTIMSTMSTGYSVREWNLEWRLLQAIEPQEARRIEMEADQVATLASAS